MDKYLAEAWVLMLVLKALWILVVPMIIIVAATLLWHTAPRWISLVFLASAFIGIVASVPQFLIMLHSLTPQQYGQIAIPLVIASGVTRLAAAIALLALAIRMKRMTAKAGTEVRV